MSKVVVMITTGFGESNLSKLIKSSAIYGSSEE